MQLCKLKRNYAFFASLLLVSACTIQLRVKIDLAEDGSGQITAGIGLDEQARNQPAFQNVDEALRISDLLKLVGNSKVGAWFRWERVV